MFIRKAAQLILEAPELGYLRPLLREAVLHEAKVFSTPEALKDYLKEHPGADKSKHRVEKARAPKEQRDHGDQVDAIMKNFEMEESDKKELRDIANSSRAPKDIADAAKGRLNAAEKEADKIPDEKIRADVKKEFEAARGRTNKQLTKFEETLATKMDDPKRARAVRDYLESSIMFKYVRDEAKRVKKMKKQDVAKKNFDKKPKAEE